MKIILSFTCTALLIFSAVLVKAQEDSTMNLPNFLFPGFTNSIIKLKSGTNKTAVVNYNVVDQELVFVQEKTYVVLDEPWLIDTVYVAERKFVPFNKAFYEVLISGAAPLYMQYKSTVEAPGAPTGFGSTTKDAPRIYVKQVYGIYGAVNLKIPDDYKINTDNYYWIIKNGLMEKFINQRQFLKIFKNKEEQLRQFISANSIQFKEPADVIKLVNYTQAN